ncbi:hypothetical protein U9M48_007231 [Paspalum notatum var. saurae]|uniref:DUF3741 domain-containing protein n=1 Tax=Paspalum notatum var. saurae TaxID=547442 RepID=A0AAQ3PRA8_PASNO
MQPPPGAEPGRRRASSSTSSTCSTAPRRGRGIGCMAGILRLISPYHRSQHRKRLTAKNAVTAKDSAAPPPPRKKAAAAAAAPLSPGPPAPVKPTTTQPPAARRRRSCDAPRSPTIAMEHRRSSCDSPRPPPPAIVARLMGLEESAPPSPAAASSTPRPQPVVLPTRPPPPPPPTRAPSPPESAAEKRRKLLGALEKCDEDLKTLRRIIAAVRAAEMRAAAASDAGLTPAAGKSAAAKWAVGRDGPSPSPPTPQQLQQQHPSPDSVLDAISSPRYPCRRKRPSPCTDLDAGGKAGCGNGAVAVAPTVVVAASRIVKPSRTLVFSGDYYYSRTIKSSVGGGDESLQTAQHAAVRHPVPPLVSGGGLPRSAGSESWRHHRRRLEQEAAAAGRVIGRAMVESVAEAMMWAQVHQQQQGGVARDDDEAQRCERGWVAAALERAIAQDLVADVVAELLAQSGHGTGRCRKRLCF